MLSCVFTNDNNVVIHLPDHECSGEFVVRDNHEVLFRRIHTFMIQNKYITENIIDAGAWIGDNAIPWAKNISGIVYAIDPSERNCRFIQQVADLNNICNVKVIQTALSDKNETLSTNQYIEHCSFVKGVNGYFQAEAQSLDSMMSSGIIQNVDCIHLDVEGFEFNVIKGADQLISECRPIVSFEQHLESDKYGDICEHFKQRDYMVYMIDETLPGCLTDCRNFLAVPSEKSLKFKSEVHCYLNMDNLLIDM